MVTHRRIARAQSQRILMLPLGEIDRRALCAIRPTQCQTHLYCYLSYSWRLLPDQTGNHILGFLDENGEALSLSLSSLLRLLEDPLEGSAIRGL